MPIKILPPAETVELLRCAKCNNYLSQFPVYIYEELGDVCGRCPLMQDKKRVRNVMYESIADFIVFPCRYEAEGCISFLTPSEVADHEDSCMCRPYSCPLIANENCQWKGNMNNVLVHFYEKHADSVMEEDSMKLNLTLNFKCTFLTILKENIFFLNIENDCDSSKIWISMNLMGSRWATSNYLYDITLKNNVAYQESKSNSILPYGLCDDTASNKVVLNTNEISSSETMLTVALNTQEIIKLKASQKSVILSISQNILELLECPVCLEIFKKPIMCLNGHSICYMCATKIRKCPLCSAFLTNTGDLFNPKKHTENYTLNSIIATMKFFCKYYERGCKIASSKPLSFHELHCTYALKDCPLLEHKSCHWKGNRHGVAQHVKQAHHDDIIQLGQVHIPFDVKDLQNKTFSDKDVLVILKCGDVFKLNYKYWQETFCWEMQCCGLLPKNTQYLFEIEVIDNNGNGLGVISRGIVSPETMKYEISSINLPLYSVRHLIKGGDMTYKVKIMEKQ